MIRFSTSKLFFFTISLLFTFSLSAQVPPICMAPHADYSVTSAYGVCSGDFNEDGNPDIATANFQSNTISILLGSSTGTFGAPTNYPALGLPRSITPTDINNDSHLDLVVCTNSIYIFMGDGSGSFTVTSTPPVVTSNPFYAAPADYNGDGNIDLAVTISPLNMVAVYMGNGAGVFAAAVNYTVGQAPQQVISADFNNDNKPDLAVVNGQSGNTSILINTGTGTFTGGTVYFTGTDPMSVASRDFNNDGDVDLAVVHFSQNKFSVLMGNGNGSFAQAVNYTAGSQMYMVIADDFNNDGNTDLAAASYGLHSVTLLTGNGTGVFGSAKNYSVAIGPVGLASADFDGNGKQDIVAASNNYSGASVLLNKILPVISVASGSICKGQSYTLTPSGAVTYTISGGNNTVVSPQVQTNYNISGTAADGCTNTAVATISVNPLPVVNVVISNSIICEGEQTVLTATGATTYTWDSGINNSSVTVTPTATIIYTVTGNLNTCVAQSTAMVIVNNCTGISEKSNRAPGIEIYPNPASETLHIKLNSNTETAKIEIYNALGERVLSKSHLSEENLVDVSKLNSGLYFVKIVSENKVGSVKRFIKS